MVVKGAAAVGSLYLLYYVCGPVLGWIPKFGTTTAIAVASKTATKNAAQETTSIFVS